MAAITHEGRTFVFLAGNDDGLTVFELLPDGTLLHALTMADDFDVAMTNVSALAVYIIDGEIHVFVTGTEDGITQLIFDPDVLGGTFVGTTGKDTITGTAFDDHLFGGRRGDTIDGGAGNDRIDGGGGKDFLTGGEGADTFVFTADGRKDFILDFQDGLDLIDLSGYHQVGTMDDLFIKTREWGVLIEIRGEKIKIIAADGETITAEDFTVDDFIF
jgi:Ca2+-binding RTX toxin-like protein